MMSHLIKPFLLLLLMQAGTWSILAQPSQESLLKDLAQLFERAAIDELAGHFDSNLQLNLLDQKNFYSKSQASIILKEFFADKPIKSFSIQHKGGGETNWFMVGLLQTQKDSYRISLHLREVDQKRLISFLSIEPNKH